MAKSNFGGGAYTLRSLPLAAQTCVNLYMEPSELSPGEFALYSRAGLLKLATIGTGGHRDSHVAGGYLWCVIGSKLWRVASDYTATEVGTLSTSSGRIQMTDNGTLMCVADTSGWYSVNLSTAAFVAVGDSPSLGDVTFIDNYLLGAQSDGTYLWAELNSLTIDVTNFASAEGHPDKILRTLSDHRELWLFGLSTVEVAVVTGDADLPFTRTAFIEQGILAPQSACKEDNSVFWLGRNESGQGIVYRAQGYTPTRVSTFAIEQAIASYADPSAATAYTYQQDGHHYYVLNFAEATWAYDINVGLWHQLAYRDTLTGETRRYRGESHAFFNGVHLVGDWEDGRLYKVDPSTFTDDGDPIHWERVWSQIQAENKWMTFHRGELLAEMGVGLSVAGDGDDADPQVWLSWSNDGGRTWGNEHERSIGRTGEYRQRAIWRRMGKARRRYFRLRGSAPVRTALYEFNLDMDVSTV
jgi:hypothetical protein